MTRRLKFLTIAGWIIFSRAYDAYSTYQYTPDLSHEANPLVSIFGLSWTPLLIIIGLLTLYAIYAFYISQKENFNFLPAERGFSFMELAAFTYFGKKEHWTAMFYKLPRDIHRFNHYIGHLLTRGLVFAGIVSTIMWLLINYTDFYMQQYHRAEIIYGILVVGCLFIGWRWQMALYRKYQLAFSDKSSAT